MRHLPTLFRSLLATLALASTPALCAAGAPPPPTCAANAGTIGIDFDAGCLVNGVATVTATPGGDAVVPAGFQLVYLLSQTNGLIIQAVNPAPTFQVSSLDIHRIHSLVYDPNTLDLALYTGGDASVYDLYSAISNGLCAAVNVSGAPFKVKPCEPGCTAAAGSISSNNPDICLTEGSAQLSATPSGGLAVPSGYNVLYVLTSGTDLVIQAVSTDPVFTVTSAGLFTIHTLVYDPNTLDLGDVVPGTTTGFDVNALLQQGGGSICASLDVAGAEFQVADCGPPPCTASAGTLVPDQFDSVCLVDGIALLSATPNGDAVVPDGYSVAYVLTRGPELFIQNIEPDPSFEWPLTGDYTIHTLVYDPNTLDLSFVQFDVTTGFDINALLIQGGGTICGSLDVQGASFTVIDCTPDCTANAGATAEAVICSNAAPFALFPLLGPDAQPGGTWTGPNGQPSAGTVTPGVSASGTYVYFVSDVEGCPGDTAQVFLTVVAAPDAGISAQVALCSTAPVFNCLAELGGSPDANGTWTGPNGTPFNGEFDPATDTPGIHIYTVPGSAPCAAATSTLLIVVQNCCTAGTDADTTVCFTDAPFALFGLLGGNPCPGGNWIDPNNNPHGTFFIPGSDPSGVYTYIVTSTDGVVDSATVTVNVIECPNACEADAGSLTPDQNGPVCLVDGLALISATPNGDAVVPPGYSVAYVLTRGPELFIQNIEPDPSFEWPLTGDYTIHTLVYDPNTLDLSFVQFDVTTGSDINALLIQGGGNVCASLDVPGASFTIIACAPPCDADAGIGGDRILCFNGPVVDLFTLLEGTPDGGGSWTGPDDNAFGGTFDPATDAQGVYVYTVFAGADCPPDTTQLVISLIECGGQLQLHARDAGTQPAQGLSTGVNAPLTTLTLSAWPNPATDVLTVRGAQRWNGAVRVDLLDATGRPHVVPVTFTDGGAVLDLRTLAAGSYMLRVLDGTTSGTVRIARTRD